MENREKIGHLMGEIGPLLELSEIVEFEDDSWVLLIDEETDIVVEYDDGEHRLVLSSEIGPVAGPVREANLETILTYNGCWRKTGGVRLALDGDGHLLQLLDVTMTDLEASKLARVLGNFLVVRNGWAEFLDAAAKEEPNANDSDDTAGADAPEIIRV